MFDRCCETPFFSQYDIIHNPKPISLSRDMEDTIKALLWYVPNIDSFQAAKNPLIEDKTYSDFSFSYILNIMGMIEDRDVKWIGSDESMSIDDWNFYSNQICCNCQKIIISRLNSQSKTNNLLRSLRNCLAHGHFSVVEDYIIGFNLQKTKSNPSGTKKAIIKLKPKLLLDALDSLDSPVAKESLVSYAFERIGYTVIRNPSVHSTNGNYKFYPDLLVEKDNKLHYIEIKDYRGHSFLHPEHIEKFLLDTEQLSSRAERVLFIDTSRVTKAVREIEQKTTNFRIIDLSQVKELLRDDPKDILIE